MLVSDECQSGVLAHGELDLNTKGCRKISEGRKRRGGEESGGREGYWERGLLPW